MVLNIIGIVVATSLLTVGGAALLLADMSGGDDCTGCGYEYCEEEYCDGSQWYGDCDGMVPGPRCATDQVGNPNTGCGGARCGQ